MSGLRRAFILVLCWLLCACSVAVGRGVDPRESGGASGAVAGNNNMSTPGAISLVSGPAIADWLQRTFMPDQHDDAPPPPAAQRVAGERAVVEQDCTNPAHLSAGILPCP